MNETQIRAQLVTYAQRAYFRGLVHGTGGNFSARLDDERMVVTASGLSLGDTALDNLITVNVNTYQYEPAADLIPSKEYRFHADILRLRSAVGAVLHAHPVQATAYAVKGRDIPMVTDAAFKQPSIPRVPFAPSGTAELQENVARAVRANPNCKVLLLEKHGIIALGRDSVMAYDTADLIEELACIAYQSECL